MSIYPKLKAMDNLYKSVAANTEELSEGICPGVGEKISVYRFIANGAEPTAYVSLVWDRNGASETFLQSTKGDIDCTFNCSCEKNCFEGDGIKKLQISINNNNDTATPIIGGRVEVIEVF